MAGLVEKPGLKELLARLTSEDLNRNSRWAEKPKENDLKLNLMPLEASFPLLEKPKKLNYLEILDLGHLTKKVDSLSAQSKFKNDCHSKASLAELRQENLPEYVRTVRAILQVAAFDRTESYGKELLKIFLSKPDFKKKETDRAESMILAKYGIKLEDFRRDELELLKSVDKAKYFERCSQIAEDAVYADSKSQFVKIFDRSEAIYKGQEAVREQALKEHGLQLSAVRKEYAEYLRERSPEAT